MTLALPLELEMSHEMAGLRRVIERIPEDKLHWKPHERSMSMGHLMTHVIQIPRWGAVTMGSEEFDVAPGGVPLENEEYATVELGLTAFDGYVRDFGEALSKASDADLMCAWALKSAGETIFEMPRLNALRSMIMNHMIHHRAQLGLYLRLCDVPVPALFGPSADEQG